MFLVIECVIIHADAKIGSAGLIMYSFVAPGICVAIAEFYRWEKRFLRLTSTATSLLKKSLPSSLPPGPHKSALMEMPL